MIKINNVFEIGEIVYVKTDTEQLPWIVTDIVVSSTSIAYRCSHIMSAMTFDELEISREKDWTGQINYQ